MTSRRETELIQLWLEDGSNAAPDRILVTMATAIQTTPQLARHRLTRFSLLGLAAAAIIVAAVSGLLWANGPLGPQLGGAGHGSVAASPAATARNLARVRPTTPLRLTVEIPLERRYPDPDVRGLTRYEFAVDPTTGFGPFSVSLDPSAAYGGQMPTSEDLVLRFVMGEVGTTFVSKAGECDVAFETATAAVIAATFECRAIPQPIGDRPADVSGDFSFSP